MWGGVNDFFLNYVVEMYTPFVSSALFVCVVCFIRTIFYKLLVNLSETRYDYLLTRIKKMRKIKNYVKHL